MWYVLLVGETLVTRYLSLEELAEIDITQVKFRSRYPVKAQEWMLNHAPQTVFHAESMPQTVNLDAVFAWNDNP